jgi:uncharacterized repeat protein (TIGR03803 family)
MAGLILSSNTLYGTTSIGGSSGKGTVFKVNTNGTDFTVLHSFTADGNGTNSDGANPAAELILSGNTLYGTALFGGGSGDGTVFKVNTDGTGFTTVYSFTAYYPNTATNSDGAYPGGLILSGNTLYGTGGSGGASSVGTVFAVNTDGTDFTNLHSFNYSDGAYLFGGGLVLSGNVLIGTASQGGSADGGTVFAINTNGTGFTILHHFAAGANGTNTDGGGPSNGLILSGNILYGTAFGGGNFGRGTVFAMNTDGTGFTNLHSFTAAPAPTYTNSDGNRPRAGLSFSGSTLYGTTSDGGLDNGTVFKLKTDGTGFTVLHSFTASGYPVFNSDGASPYGGVVLSGNTLYGTARYGGSSGNGTVFSLELPPPPPQLTIIRSTSNIILTWPTNYSDFNLLSTTNLASPVWITNFPGPVVVNGQNTVTNPISGTKQFYRLSQ